MREVQSAEQRRCALQNEHDFFAKESAFSCTDGKSARNEGFELGFDFFNLDLHCPRVNDIIQTSDEAECPVGIKPCAVVRDERLGRYGGRFNLKGVKRRKRNRYARERAETRVCRRAVQSAQATCESVSVMP